MKFLNKFTFIYLTLHSFLFSESNTTQINPWKSTSVSLSDNLSSLEMNPAGLAVNNGHQSGIFIPLSKYFIFHTAERFNGFGYSLEYEFSNELKTNIFSPKNGNIGFAFSPFNNFYLGAKWNKHRIIDLGSILRPSNFISIGLVSNVNDVFDKVNYTDLGISIRPLFNNLVTIGSDIRLYNESNYNISPHLIFQLKGLSFTVNSPIDKHYNFSIKINFNKADFFTSGNSQSLTTNLGFGAINHEYMQESILDFNSSKQKRYVRMDLEGLFIEEPPAKPPFTLNINLGLFNNLNQEKGTQLRTWIDKIYSLSDDPNIDGLIIDLGSVRAGFSKRSEMRNALEVFQESGKKIIVYANKGISNMDYYLVSLADKIFINEYTGINLKGLNMEVTFIRGLLDTLNIVPEVFRVNYNGKSYKTAADQLLNRKMSDEMKENYGDLLSDLFEIYLNSLQNNRTNWTREEAVNIVNNGPYMVPEDAISSNLADSIMYPDQFESYLKQLNNKNISIIEWEDFNSTTKYETNWATPIKEKIAIIYAVGGIISGKSNPSPSGSTLMGDETIIKSIKDARKNKDIKAIILRIDSGGGSALASDQMWREIYKTTQSTNKDHKPFIASMSDVAASGGYYIACQADTILANKSTITGSIGVIGSRLNMSQLLNKWGIRSDVIKYGEYSDFATGSRLANQQELIKIQNSIDDVYTKFKNRVKNGRKNINKEDNLDIVAMGRVFSGLSAKENISIPLVDINGGLHDAIEVAKTAANIKDKHIEIVEFPQANNSFKHFTSSFDSHNYYNKWKFIFQTLPEEFETLEYLPVLLNNQTQTIIPYKITID